ncbi:MAG: PAS domain S-box protein [Deltaproteobacteria bacterium]|uniref:histidine kinase n=1 Tax=Candidatus Zymogenus saltonus TaxID=2844893 RepID=A0A9D8KEM3_9DELT|nr:PAS domain S-box protein [Candidatus Zymogenus saltonus]
MKAEEQSKQLNVLLIEGNNDDGLSFSKALNDSQFPFKVTEFNSPCDALNLLRKDPASFDVVVAEFILPNMSGLDVCKKIINEGINLPSVILADVGSEDVVFEALMMGVDDYIIKDPDGEYLKLLTPVLWGVVNKYNDRLARERAEEALKESEEENLLLADNIVEYVFKTDMELGMTFITESSVHTIGYTPDEMIGMKIWELCSDECHEKFEEIVAEELSKGQHKAGRTIAVNLIHKDGREVPSELNIRIIYDEDKRPTGVQGSVRDVTGQRIVEEALKESEKRYRMLVEQSDDLIYISDFEGNFKFVSSAVEKIMGLPRERLMGKNFTEVMTPESLKRASELIKRQLNREDVGSFEMEFYDKDGNIVTVETKEKWEWEDDRVVEIHGIGRNITDRKRAEKALIESEERFRLAAKSTGDLIYEWDVLTDVLDWYGDIDAALGYESGEFGRTLDAWLELINPDESKMLEDMIRRHRKKEGSFSVEYRIRRKDGSWRYWIDRGTVMLSDSGKPIKLIGACTDITERRLAEEALRKSGLQLKNILSSSAVGIGHVKDRRIVWQNEAMSDMFGFKSEEEYLGREASFFVASIEEYRSIESKILDELGSNVSLEIDAKLRRMNGTLFDGHMRISPIDPKDPSQGEIVSILDITKRKAAEEALKESEELYRNLFETALVGIWRVNIEDGKFLRSNLKCAELVGVKTVDELVKNYKVSDYFPPDKRKEFFKLLKEKGEISGFETHFTLKDGLKKYVLISAKLFHEKGYVEGVIIDITCRKLAEAALKESEEKYRNLFENSIEPVFTVDLDGNFTSINRAFEEMCGYKAGEMIGGNYRKFGDAETVEKVSKAYNLLYRTGEPIKNLNYKIFDKNGEEIIVESCVDVIRKGEKIVGFQGSIRDISDRKRIEEQLFRAQKMEALGTLAGGIAHDFNNILATILGYASFLKNKASKSDPFYEGLSTIESSALRASDLTSQLLAYSRKGKIEVKTININRIVQDVYNFIVKTFDKSIKIKIKMEDGLYAVEGDESQLNQVIMNLAINARDAMPDGGLLEILTFSESVEEEIEMRYFNLKPGEYVCLKCVDTGIGMDEEIIKRVFEPYFTTRGDKGGTGLGMSVVFGIIKGHDGYIDISSAPGEGTEVKVYFPASKKKEDLRYRKLVGTKSGSETLLAIDDEKTILSMLKGALPDYGYKVFSANSGEEGIKIYRENKDEIDLIILDIKMPDMDGKAVLDEMMKINPDVRVLLSSGFNEEDQHLDLLENGAVGFIGKPFVLDKLLETMRKVLN